MAKTLKIDSPVSNVAEQMLGGVATPSAEHDSESTELPALKRKPRPEAKSKRVSFLFRPSICKNLSLIADAEGVSVNSLVNDFLEQSIKRYAKANAS